MIKVIIVDDELSALEMISSLLRAESREIVICATSTNIDDAIRDIATNKPDLLFLDVELSDGTGFDILDKFPDLKAHVIFVTAYEQYSLKAIKRHAFDYILKPIAPEEFTKTVNEAIKKIKSAPGQENYLREYFEKLETRKIALPDRNGYKYYDIDTIIFLEAEGSYTKIYFTDGSNTLISKGLREFEAPLHDKRFLRVHKSYYVNITYIAELRKEDGGYLVMSNGKSVPLASKNRDEVLNQLRYFTRPV